MEGLPLCSSHYQRKIYFYLQLRIICGFLVAIPLGLLDGVTAFALKPFMDYVVGKQDWIFHTLGHEFTLTWQMFAFIIPFGVIAFAGFQGVLRYLNDYISAWTSQRITNDVKFDLFHKLIYMDPQFYDENPSGIIISRYMADPQTASAGIVDQIKTITTSLFGALGLIGVMLYSSWKLAFIGVLVLCIAFIPVALIRKRIKATKNKNAAEKSAADLYAKIIRRRAQPCWSGGIWYKRTHGRGSR